MRENKKDGVWIEGQGMIYFCVDGKQKQILKVFGAEAAPSLKPLLPCAALCNATVMRCESVFRSVGSKQL